MIWFIKETRKFSVKNVVNIEWGKTLRFNFYMKYTYMISIQKICTFEFWNIYHVSNHPHKFYQMQKKNSGQGMNLKYITFRSSFCSSLCLLQGSSLSLWSFFFQWLWNWQWIRVYFFNSLFSLLCKKFDNIINKRIRNANNYMNNQFI